MVKSVSEKLCEERTGRLLDAIKGIKTNDLVHLEKKIDNIKEKINKIESRMWYIIIVGIAIAFMAGVNILSIVGVIN